MAKPQKVRENKVSAELSRKLDKITKAQSNAPEVKPPAKEKTTYDVWAPQPEGNFNRCEI